MRGPTQTPRTPAGVGGCTASIPIRRRRRTCGGSSPAGSPAYSTSRIARELNDEGCRARRGTTVTGISTAAARRGRCERSRRSSPIRATPVGRSGTANAPTTKELRQRQGHGAGAPNGGGIRRASGSCSRDIAHPPLVSEQDFVAVQEVRATPMPRDGQQRTYLLTGLVRCGYCGRRMDAHWANGRAGYRCRHGRTSANPPRQTQRRPLYVREDRVGSSAAHQLGFPLDAVTTVGHLAEQLRASDAAIVCTAAAYHLFNAGMEETD